MAAALIDLAPPHASMRDEVLQGLSRPRKTLPSKFFYDRRGSQLFDEICELPEYYLTRTELDIMHANRHAIADALGRERVIVEFGSGSSEKVRLLLDSLEAPVGYMPIDISRTHLKKAADQLARDYPEIHVTAICADFTTRLDLDGNIIPNGRSVGFFPGSTIGNFTPREATGFLARAASLLGTGGGLLIGVDLKKDPAILHAAYNDGDGVTATFNLNMLAHINASLAADFDLSRFRHYAFYNVPQGRVEMHLVSTAPQTVNVADRQFTFAEGESIHTENSYKYTV
ncbi:MAG: L-histidine N(alpha)-methyltransferase, partial [Alphaproteobacteria bacterium]